MEELLARQNIRISNITNPFDPMHNREFKEVPRGLSLKECIDLVRDPLSGCFYVAAVNGELVPEGTDYALVYPQGNVVLCAVPEGGGGGGGKNTLRIVLQLVVVIVAAAATVYFGGAGGAAAAAYFGVSNAVVGMVAGMAISVVGNLLIGALLPYDMGTDVAGSEASSQESSTYSWQGATNSNREGVVWPVLYGTMRITPPIIGKYIEVVGDLQYLNILYAVADHAIDSIDETSIKINDNLVTKNVDGITWEYRLGALNQTPIQYFNDARTMKSSGAKLSTSWTTIDADGTETEGLGIAVSFPRGLYSAQNDGTIGGFSVALNIEYKEASASTWTRLNTYRQTPLTVTTGRWSAGYYDGAGGWCEVLAGTTTVGDHIEGEAYYQADYSQDQWIYLDFSGTATANQPRKVAQWHWVTTTTIVAEVGSIENTYVTVSGAQTSAIRRVFYADRIPAGSYQVRVALVSAESTDTKIGDDTYLEYVESIIYDDFSYPGSTVFALRALATDKLSGGMPVISMIATRSTVPVWTGAAYENLPADNPAWASYDVLHDSNYGGGVDYSKIIYADYLKWANNCDLHYTSVGVASPVSFKCNYYVDAGTSVRKILNDLGVLGRGNTVQMGSYFTCFVDKLESLPAQSFLFNMGNIEAKSFSIEYMEMESRANAVDVTFWDKDNNYDQKTLEIHASDFDATTTEIKKTQITLRGCTTRAEALAHGNFAMNNNRLLTTTANWSADIDAIGCLPWDVVEAQHDHTLWGDGGLVVSGTTDTVVLDKELTLAADTTYTLNIQSIATDEIKQYTLATLQEETTTAAMVITTTFDPIPTEHDKWTISTVGVSTKLFRLMRTTRMDDLTRKLVCLEYNPDIYDDSGALDAPEVPVLPTYEAHLQAREIQKWNGSPDTEIQLSWTGFALRWHVFWKKASGVLGESNWRYAGATMEPMLRIPSLDQQADVYTFCVSHTQNPADGITVDLAVTGTAIIAIPGTPVNLTAAVRGQVIVLQWNAATDVSVTGYTVYLNGSAITTNFGGIVYVYAETLTAGVYNFTLAAVNRGGTSTPTDAASLTIAVPTTPTPTAVIVGEQVVVTWADCKTTLPIAYYKVNAVQQSRSTRYLDRINWVGAKDYDIIAIDACGNESGEGTTSITVIGIPSVTGIIATGHPYNIRLDLTYEMFDEFETVEIWSNTTNNRTGAVKVGETAAPAWTHSGLSLIDTRYYWTRIRNIYGTVGAWYPLSSTAGTECSTSRDPADYLAILNDSITSSQLTADLRNEIDTVTPEAILETILATDESRSGNHFAERKIDTLETDISTEVSERLLLRAAILGANGLGTTAGVIYEERLVRVSAEGAIASNVSTLSSTVGGHTTSISTNASAISTVDGNFRGTYTLRVNAGGRVAGFGLAMAAGTPSEFIILADKFQVVDPSDTLNPKAAFTVGHINGVDAVGINGDLIIDGSILAKHIAANQITAAMYHELRQSYCFTWDDSLDASYPLIVPFRIVSEMTAIVSVKVSFRIMPFRAYSTGMAAGGGTTITSASGGGASGGGGGAAIHVSSTTHIGILPDHTHPIAYHDHSVSVSDHSHTLAFGLYEEANSPTIHFHVDNGSGYGGASSNYTSDQADLAITSSISGAGWKNIKFESTLRCRLSIIIECKVDITA